MGDLSDIQRDQILGARIAGATVAETVLLLEISWGIVSKVMPTYERDNENIPAMHIYGRSSSLSLMDRRTLNRVLRIDHKTTAGKIRAELNEHLEISFNQNHSLGVA